MENSNNIKYLKDTNNIPDELKQLNIWLVWKAIYEGDRFKKIPYDPHTGRMARVNDKSTWGTYEQAIEACEKYKLSGIGIVLLEENQIVGIDIDKCIDDEGTIDEKAMDIINTVQGYTEISPSARGIRILCKGTIPKGRTRNDNVEMYFNNRYLTITGNVVEGYPNTIEDRTEAVNIVYNKYIADKVKTTIINQQTMLNLNPQSELLNKIMKSKNGEKIMALYNGDTSEYGGDDSAADMALCNYLAYWTSQNSDMMDKIFRSSGLFRIKWDEVHYANGETYGQYTINKAIKDCRYTFNSSKGSNSKDQIKKDNSKGKAIISKDKLQEWYIKNEKTGNTTVNSGLLSKHLIKNEKIICIGSNPYMYKDGVYIKCEDQDVIHIIKKHIDDRYQSRRIIEDVKYLWLTDTSIKKSPNDVNKDIFIIVADNGLYNLKDKNICDHSSEYISTIKINTSFDPFSECPNFMKYISEVADNEIIDLIQEIVGYFLIPTNKAQKSFMLVGPTNTGKSTFLNIVKLLLGKENYISIPFQNISEKFYTAELFGKLANIAGDISDKAIKDSSFFKMATGEDAIMGERKYGTPFSFENTARFLFACNKLPDTLDHTDAFYQRIILLPFYNQVKDINPFLMEKLHNEKDGIFFWALKGLERLINNNFKFSEPKEVLKLIEDYKIETSNVVYFVKERCLLDSDSYIGSKELYDAYRDFCNYQALRSLSQQRFNFELLNSFKRITKKQLGIERKRCFDGIRVS